MRAFVLTTLTLLAGSCGLGCNTPSPPLPAPTAVKAPIPPLTPDDKQKILGKWERDTIVSVERIEFRADGTVEWLERPPSGGPLVRRSGLDERPVTFRFQGDNTIELLSGGRVFTAFKDVQVTDEKLVVGWLGPTITFSRVK
jgi:hypothetical protein